MSSQNEIPEETKERLKEQASRIRASGKNPPIHEVLIIKTLAASLNEFPLRKNQLVIQAAYLVPEEMRPHVPNEWLDRLNKVNTALLTARTITRERGFTQFISVSWPFHTGEDYKKYIGPWIGERLGGGYVLDGNAEAAYGRAMLKHLPSNILDSYNPLVNTSGYSNPEQMIYEEKCGMLARDINRGKVRVPFWAEFFYFQGVYSLELFDELRNKFITWADPQISEISATIAAILSPQGRSLLVAALFPSPKA
jgi:hypothetical protein